MIVVSMTSWTKRINNVKTVVESIMNNTVKPDRVYLNLSISEFKGIELPKDLVNYFNSDNRLIINWVDGENTKPMKKVFPILKYLDDEDIIIDADDDILFPKDLIESRINDFRKHKQKYSICSSKSNSGLGVSKVVAVTTLFQKKMLKHWDEFVNDTIIHTYNDDRTYLYIMFLNGYVTKSPSKYTNKELLEKYSYHNEISPMIDADVYLIGKKYDDAVKNVVLKLTKKSIQNSFGFFKKKDILEKKIINKIDYLRKSIREGSVVKTHIGGGKYVWKKINK